MHFFFHETQVGIVIFLLHIKQLIKQKSEKHTKKQTNKQLVLSTSDLRLYRAIN